MNSIKPMKSTNSTKIIKITTAPLNALKILPLALLVSACSFVPQFEKPEVNLSTRWVQMAIEEQSQNTEDNVQALGWREFFRDPQLQSLIATALEHNHNLKTAALNVQLAMEQYGIQKSNQLPSVGLNASAARSRTGATTSPTGKTLNGEKYSVGLGMSNFELDFFGRTQALSEAALNQYFQTQEARDAAQLSIIGAVAKAYYAARVSKALMDVSDRVLKARQESTRLAKMQYDAGIITGVTLHNYESAIETARADYYQFKRNYHQAQNALSVLLGVPVEQLSLPPSADLSAQFEAFHLPAGIPSSILQKRPDVRQAEYQLKAANANIGAAKAALFPRISLTSNLGYASTALRDLLKKPSLGWAISPSISLPIFDRKKLKSNVRVSELSQKIAVENYQQTLKTAFQEAANALIARQTYDKQHKATQRAVVAQNKAIRLEKMRFKAGITDGLTLIDAERNRFGTQQAELAVQLSLLQNMVSLYTAMGGGLSEYGVSLPVVSE